MDGERREAGIDGGSTRAARAWMLVAAWVSFLAVVMLAPVFHGGYLLGHDMVFTPRQPLDADAFGLGTAAPRAVPLDALVALAERVMNGAVVGRLALFVPLVAAGIGVAALMGRSTASRLAAATAATWNPYVVERLALGQWALLWCYAALPWLVVTVVRGRGRGRWAGRAVATAAASITPTGGVVALVSTLALVVAGRRPRREISASTALALALQLPWLVPALVSPAGRTSDPGGVAAFAARAEHHGGVLLTLLGGGGIWNGDVTPDSRSGVLPWLWLVLLAVAAPLGVGRLRRRLGRGPFAALVGLAAAGLVVAWLPALPGGAALTRAAIAHVPGAGLLRDAQKWILPLVVLEALVVGAAAARVAERLRPVGARAVLSVAVAALPLIALPDAAATLRPVLRPVHYPHDWSAVAARVAGPGDVAVLPWGSYRTFAWAPGRSVLDPAPRLLPRAAVVDDRLAVGGQLLGGEDPRAAHVASALAAGAALPTRLAAAGVGWVVVEHGTPGSVPELAGLSPVYTGGAVSLYRVPGPIAHVGPSGARVTAVVIGDALAAGALFVPLLGWAVGWTTRRKTRRSGTTSLL